MQDNYFSHLQNTLSDSLFNNQMQRRLFDGSKQRERFGFPPEVFDGIQGFSNNRRKRYMNVRTSGEDSVFNTMTPLLTIDTNYDHTSPINRANYNKKQSYRINNYVPGEVLDKLMQSRSSYDKRIVQRNVN